MSKKNKENKGDQFNKPGFKGQQQGNNLDINEGQEQGQRFNKGDQKNKGKL